MLDGMAWLACHSRNNSIVAGLFPPVLQALLTKLYMDHAYEQFRCANHPRMKDTPRAIPIQTRQLQPFRLFGNKLPERDQ
jgi:hypothetical protein